MTPRSIAFGVLAASAVVFASGGASAQVHWDASATAGPSWRAVIANGGDAANLGAAAQLAGHVALLPLVRVGLALGGEAEPRTGEPTTWLAWGNVRARIFSPWPSGTTRLFLHAGVGAVYERQAGFAQLLRPLPLDTAVTGRFLEIPVGIGGTARIWDRWWFVGELGLRIGLAHAGSRYEQNPFERAEQLGLALLLGIQYDR